MNKLITYIRASKKRDVLGESGAFLLLGLIAILIVFMMVLSMYDTGTATRTKVQSQVAADTSAYSASVVRARIMNEIAFANVAKRTIVGITAGYSAMYQFFVGVTLAIDLACGAGYLSFCLKAFKFSALAILERVSDYRLFKRNLRTSYKEDILALNNIQRYYNDIGPWWVWSEGMYRASRNGATAASTYPVPKFSNRGLPGKAQVGINLLKQLVFRYEEEEYLDIPVEHNTDRNAMKDALQSPDYSGNNHLITSVFGCFTIVKMSEGCLNVLYNYFENGMDRLVDPIAIVAHPQAEFSKLLEPAIGKTLAKYIGGFLSTLIPDFSWGYNSVISRFSSAGQPFELKDLGHGDKRSQWYHNTSLVMLTYTSREELSKQDRKRYSILPREYNRSGKMLFGYLDPYAVSGFWNISKSEIFYKGGETPDLWHTKWTARMRPLNLEQEWNNKGHRVSRMVLESYPFMVYGTLLSSPTSIGDVIKLNDVANIAKTARGINETGVNGVGK